MHDTYAAYTIPLTETVFPKFYIFHLVPDEQYDIQSKKELEVKKSQNWKVSANELAWDSFSVLSGISVYLWGTKQNKGYGEH